MEVLQLKKWNTVHHVYYDLESFYWVFVWLVLRHTRNSLGHGYCSKVFACGDTRVMAAQMKYFWILPFTVSGVRRFELQVESNAPLTALMEDLRVLMADACYCSRGPPPTLLTHDSILRALRKSIAHPAGWPREDSVPCTPLPEKTLETPNVDIPEQGYANGFEEKDDSDRPSAVDADVLQAPKQAGSSPALTSAPPESAGALSHKRRRKEVRQGEWFWDSLGWSKEMDV
ncbi:hypothetical protein C8T65DRAFT_739490 [Cerioporus squamosus]|nr:hypothetical protein C8T65DRAFT_739490 [Cerioporus squamosus]